MFVVLMRGRNCGKYVGSAIGTLASQTNKDWRAHLILDDPDDNSKWAFKNAMDVYGVRDKFELVIRRKRKGLSYNMWNGVHEACPDADDVVAVFDADDKLMPNAFEIVAAHYSKRPKLLATYGSYKKRSKGARTRISNPYPKGARVREYPWRASHLKTFKYSLFQHLPKSEMQYKGIWLPAASDVALMIPLLEMAGMDRVKHIHKMIYSWRDNTPHKTSREMQIRCEKIIRAKRPLRKLK